MTLYLDISRAIASRVVSEQLQPGAELPSIRELARQQSTTAATVGRAYRHLASAGVIAQGDRRRARLAPEGGPPPASSRPRLSSGGQR
jgi:DNA-binding transcriptional regulator YhcF (GntR family)